MRGEEKKLAENRERVEVIRDKNIIFKWNSDRVVRLMESFGLKLQNLKLICVIATVRS